MKTDETNYHERINAIVDIVEGSSREVEIIKRLDHIEFFIESLLEKNTDLDDKNKNLEWEKEELQEQIKAEEETNLLDVCKREIVERFMDLPIAELEALEREYFEDLKLC